MTKKEQMVIAGIRCLHKTINEHVAAWQSEFKNNDGVLKANYKIAMYTFRKVINQLYSKFENIKLKDSYINSFVDDLKDFNLIVSNRETKNFLVDPKKQRYLPGDDFIDNIYLTNLFLARLQEEYELTIQRMNLESDFDKIIKNVNYYSNFFEKEIVIK
ncbi:hypothetical protein [Fusobacterium hominis]|uniref:Uncharacterized protein n=1 Tax=Fusobacterium hominis TaxID=2764326 RepID=A0A7G9GXF4_9FUSO|nr:hypothetical protein [Fusobacterium hominis]QNM15486.1 hypothetical protein H9Q81_01205 [Fusobacterium hominis]